MGLVSMGLILSGCGMLFTAMKGDKAIKDLYFTFIGYDNPFKPDDDYGIVIGKITMNCGPYTTGSIFSIKNAAGETVPVKLEYKQAKQYGLIKWKKAKEKMVNYVYAGDYTEDTKGDYKEFVGTGNMAKHLIMRSTGTMAANMMNMDRAMPMGWFMIKLPAGDFRITDARADYFENQTSSNIAMNTQTTTVTKYSNSLRQPISFRVKPGKITYAGSYHVEADGELTSSHDSRDAQSALEYGLQRLNVVDPVWEITD